MTVLISWPVEAGPLEAGPSPAARPAAPSALALPARSLAARGAARPLAPGPSPLGLDRLAVGRQTLSLRAGMAELVLLNRLHARTRRELNQEMLERAARVIGVTARHWLGDA